MCWLDALLYAGPPLFSTAGSGRAAPSLGRHLEAGQAISHESQRIYAIWIEITRTAKPLQDNMMRSHPKGLRNFHHPTLAMM